MSDEAKDLTGERCVCASVDGLIRCSDTATKADGLCDFCRTAKGGHR